MQTYEVEGSARPDRGYGGIRRSTIMKGPELTIDGRATLFEIFTHSARQFPGNPCLGYRPTLDGEVQPFVFETYEEVYYRALAFGSGLNHLSLCQKNDLGHRFLGFFGENQPSWIVGELGAYSKRIIPVPLYDTLGVDACKYAIELTDMDTVVCSSVKFETVLVEPELLGLVKAVILMDSDMLGEEKIAELITLGEDVGIQVYSMEQIELFGEENESPIEPAWGKDIAFLCFTSGTTGAQPKGAMITHEGVISSLSSMRNFGLDTQPDDIHLSYLPLAHVFERAMVFAMLYAGGCVGFLMDDIKRIVEGIKALRPTIFPTVPRLLNKMFDKIMAGVEQVSPLKQRIFHQALMTKLENLKGITTTDKLRAAVDHLKNNHSEMLDVSMMKETPFNWSFLKTKTLDFNTHLQEKLLPEINDKGGIRKWLYDNCPTGTDQATLKHSIFDRIVFEPLKKKVGLDRCRLMVTGSASVAGATLDFFRAAFGIDVLEGYGMTESSVMISVTLPGDFSTGHVGVPAPCNEIRLVDVPDMGYLATDSFHSDGSECLGRGEITFRGPNSFKGYYKNDEKTAETIDEDGFVHTGDIGLFTKDGKLRIIDRKKNLFKLSQGEYIAPEKIEQVALRSPLVSQVFVYGDSLQSTLVAIVVPDLEVLSELGLKAHEKSTIKAIHESISKEEVAAKLKGFEKIRAVHIEPSEKVFTVECLTATMKLKRNVARDYYRSAIDEMYKTVAF